METAEAILGRWGQMESDRIPWDALWQRAANFGMPRKANMGPSANLGAPGTNPGNRLFDTTLVDCISTLASGHSSAITPAGSQWFAWEAPDEVKSDEADAWYNRASEITRKILTTGNFHTMLNEGFEDRSGLGLFCMGAMPHAFRKITYQTHPVGSFCCEEDSDGNVDTVFIKRSFKIAQLVQLFGEDVAMRDPILVKSWEDFRLKGINRVHELIHATFPRLDAKPGRMDALSMPIASVWVTCEGKVRLVHSGMEELPYMVSRYLKRSGAGQQYGYSPFSQVERAVLNANKLKQILQVVRQKQGVPPLLIPDYLTGNVDTRPGGQTVFRSDAKHLPQEWLTRANPQGLVEELEDERLAIRMAFHTDLFRMFANREKVMTAREVAELAAEKLMPFSPSFTRFTADFQPSMERTFAILFRAGSFGRMDQIPESVQLRSAAGVEVLPPKVVYQSRIALAIRQAETAAADRMIERALAISEVSPEAFDNINVDSYLRLSGRNDGVSEDMLRPEADMMKIREARAEAAQQQAQLEQAETAANAAGKVGLKVA